MAQQMILGYWNTRGIAHPIRLLLKVADVDFKDQLYDETNRDTWLSVKNTLDLELPNLPYLIDGDTKLTQSLAILRYLGRKLDLAPETEVDRVRVEVLELQVFDWLIEAYKLWYLPKAEFEEKKGAYEETMDRKLNLLEAYITGPYVLGDKLTYVDLLLYTYLDSQRRFIPGLLKSTPKLDGLVKKIESLDQVSEYLNSDEFKEVNYITSSQTSWGNREVGGHLDVE